MPTNVKTYDERVESMTPEEVVEAHNKLQERIADYYKGNAEHKQKVRDACRKSEDPSEAVFIDNIPAWTYLGAGWDLSNLDVWDCTVADPINRHIRWLTPELLERLCIMNPELRSLCENVKDIKDEESVKKVEEKLINLLTKGLLPIMIKKFQQIKHELSLYFIALAHTGLCWDEREISFIALLRHLGYPDEVLEPDNARNRFNSSSEASE